MRLFSRWQFGNWFGLLFWVGSLLRLFSIGEPRRWYDEIFTAWAAVLPFDRMLAATAGDVHPPAHYALMWLVAHVFNSNATWLLRLPSALLSIAAMPLLALIGRRLKLSDGAILVGVAFMAFASFQLYYAQEIRMYAMLQCEVLLAVLAVLDRRWWLLSLSGAAMLWTHNYGLVFCAVIFGLALVRELGQPVKFSPANLKELPWQSPRDQANFGAVILAGLVSLALYAPWASVLIGQIGALDKWWGQPTTLGWFFDPIQQFVWGNPLGILQPITQIVTFTLFCFSAYKMIRLRSGVAVQLLALGVIPMLISLAIELFTPPTYLYRSFIGSSGFIYLLFGWALTERVPAPMRRWAGSLLAPLFAAVIVMYYPMVGVFKGAANVFLPELQRRMEPGDFVYHMNPGSLLSFRDEHPDDPVMYGYVHPALPGDVGTLSSQTLQAFGVREVELEQIPWRRAWLIYSAGPTLGIAEDNEVAAMVEQYHGTLILHAELMYSKAYEAQIWLLTR